MIYNAIRVNAQCNLGINPCN